ncbi:helix-turn-helix domain-containing protein [Escherichia coli]|nr:helix-turn-helix domain-containing protein [Escherichia coli]
METKNLTIGERIRYRRKNLKHTQRSLAKALKISHVSVSQWERGDSEPTGKNLLPSVKYCNAHQHGFYLAMKTSNQHHLLRSQLPYPPKELELLELFNALPESEQDTQLAEMRARVKNFNKLFEELLKARQRTNKR